MSAATDGAHPRGADADDVRAESVDIGGSDARGAIAAYFAELDRRFPGGFDAGAGGADHDAAAMRPPHGAFLLLRAGDDVIGCGGVQRVDVSTAEIKRMWIDGARRGEGLGRRLLGELEATARRLGYAHVVLDTNGALTEAIAMYERSGYVRIERYNDNPYAQHWFARAL